MRLRHNYDPAFRKDTVELLDRTDRGFKAVSASLGIPQSTLRYWYDQEMARRRGKPKVGGAPTLSSLAAETVQQKLERLERENAALRKEVDDLRLDKDILKKAAAFFAKESK
jgi:transposase